MNKATCHPRSKRRTIPMSCIEYRPKLEELAAFAFVKASLPIDITDLCKDICLSADADYFEEIYAVIPVERPTRIDSCVIYRETVLLVEKEPFTIVQKLLETVEHLDYTFYKRALEQLMGTQLRMVPVSTRTYSMFPTGAVSRADTLWINPGRVEAHDSFQMKTIIRLSNVFTIAIDRRTKSLRRSMERAFTSHAIIKRAHEYENPNPHTNLLAYLNIHSSNITRDILRSYEYQHIPGRRRDFFQIYTKIQEETVFKEARQQIHQELEIEE